MIKNTPALWQADLPVKLPHMHKYDHGHTLVYGGQKPMIGASLLAARAAQRMGSGLVTIASDAETWPVYAGHCTSIMTRVVADVTVWQALLADKRVASVVIGPGAGRTARLKAFVLAVLQAKLPVVLDADALTVFADSPHELLQNLHPSCVLTPHDGEFAKLFGTFDNRQAAYQAALKRVTPATLLLKGQETLIANTPDHIVLHDDAPPWLAVAGAGDVLAGLIGGLMAQGMPTRQAGSAGAWCHAAAAKPFDYGMLPEDLMRQPLWPLLALARQPD